MLAQGRLATPEEFGNVIVRETPNGGTVRVKDVARVELGTQDYSIALPAEWQARCRLLPFINCQEPMQFKQCRVCGSSWPR